MAHVKLSERSERDPGGKKVDLYPEVGLVRTLVFKRCPETARERLLPAVVRLLARIAVSPSKRLRERDFPIWMGEATNSLGTEMSTIALPDPIAYPVFKEFYAAFHGWDAYIESGAYLLADGGGEPAARYSQGGIVVYGGAFDPPDQLPSCLRDLGVNIELRSWQLQSAGGRRTRYARAEPPRRAASFVSTTGSPLDKRHTLDSWSDNRDIILEFLYDLKAPCGFKQLQELLGDSFGIGVALEPSPSFDRYGCIRLGWLRDDDKSAPVRILINSRLDDRLKYAVLAHELAHYVQHFPLLLTGQIVEEQSWTMPELEAYYHDLLRRDHPQLLRDVELDAFELASFFLIPPQLHPVGRFASAILERGQNPEPALLIWRWLQTWFPEGSAEPPSWSRYDAIRERADREVQSAMRPEDGADSLFGCTLAAALRVESDELSHSRVEGEILAVLQKILGLLAMTAPLDLREARENIRRRLSRDGEAAGPDLPNLDELSLGTRSFCRELIPPLRPQEGTVFFPRIPLVPASFNPTGEVAGDWQYLQRLDSSPYGTVEDWRNHRPEYGVVLYRFETWQQELLRSL
ncbi:MAG TPA: hypothetical protein VGC93_02135 [Thermoanaerobaculia bacterium]